MKSETKTMRDVFIEQIYNRMHKDNRIFFLSADFGAPMLDRLKADFPNRFINIGKTKKGKIRAISDRPLNQKEYYLYEKAA